MSKSRTSATNDPAAVPADYSSSMAGLSPSDTRKSCPSIRPMAADSTFTRELGSAYTGSSTAITTTESRSDAASSATTTETNTVEIDPGDYVVLDTLPANDIADDGFLSLQDTSGFTYSNVLSGAGVWPRMEQTR